MSLINHFLNERTYGFLFIYLLRPRSVFGSFGIVLMSYKVHLHVVLSALQNSVCNYINL